MIQKTRKGSIICITLLVLNLAFIWGNSLLPATSSGAFSEWIRALLSSFFPPADAPQGGHLIRKLAHFSEFASLGLLLTWLAAMSFRKRTALVAIPLLSGFLSACLDETIQIFSPGRGPSPVDVGIDTAGVAVGIAVLIAGHTVFKKIHKPMEELL